MNLFLLIVITYIIYSQELFIDDKRDKIIKQRNKNFDMIQVNFFCDQVNNDNNKLCNKVRKSIDNVALIINKTFELKAPIIINASFIPICNTIEKCHTEQTKPLGAAKPSRFIPLLDNDGIERLYAQALYKQIQLTDNNEELSEVDIISEFNSKSTEFWFRGDPEIGENQVDFEIVVLHEFLHGLGFISSWNDYIIPENPRALTPYPKFIIKSNRFIFSGFREYALDRHLVLTKTNHRLTIITNKLNQFVHIKSNYTNKIEFARDFIKSSQYIEAKEMFNYSVTRNSIFFELPDENENVFMETSLVPYVPSSSFTHIDYNTYNNTTEFLMRYKAPRKVVLDDLKKINGNDNEYTNPIGNKTIQMMKMIG